MPHEAAHCLKQMFRYVWLMLIICDAKEGGGVKVSVLAFKHGYDNNLVIFVELAVHYHIHAPPFAILYGYIIVRLVSHLST